METKTFIAEKYKDGYKIRNRKFPTMIAAQIYPDDIRITSGLDFEEFDELKQLFDELRKTFQ
jgi:hypothetical protein